MLLCMPNFFKKPQGYNIYEHTTELRTGTYSKQPQHSLKHNLMLATFSNYIIMLAVVLQNVF